MAKINGVAIGDRFKRGNLTSEVVDIYRTISIKTGEHIGFICIAKGIGSLAQNEYEVPFSTVAINRIQ